jgi:hypothetical protein
MKKYLMIGFAAVAFAACSNHDFETYSQEQIIQNEYKANFIQQFGQPASNQDWGFGASTRAFTRGIDPDANMWADTYKVPTQLTQAQKDLVRKYFQQNPIQKYEDPKLTNFFMQQVYKGGTTTKTKGDPTDPDCGSAEEYASANGGWVIGSNHMDHLAACNQDGTIKDHIYNFNFGTCSTNNDVSNSAGVTYTNPNGNYHSDEIQLALNSTTKKFGYFNSDGSLGHTEYTCVVSWKTIAQWAMESGNENISNINQSILNDDWNRSFMGFDFEQVVGEDVYQGNALYSDMPGFDRYIWDGENVIDVVDHYDNNWAPVFKEGYETLKYNGKTVRCLKNETNQYCGDRKWKDGGDLYEEVTAEHTNAIIIYKDGKKCLNMPFIYDMLDDDYLPVATKNFREWVKVEGGADGYFSDWIVTLTEAKSNFAYQGRIMVEDLSAQADVTGKNSDWDFNDVVFDWAIVDGKAYIKLLAAGGTLPIRIGGTRNDTSSEPAGSVEIHTDAERGLGGYMKNCGVGEEVPYKEFVLEDHTYTDARNILITVYKGGSWVEIQAEQGQPAAKFNCKVGTKWCDEYVNIQRVYPDFTTWVANPSTNWEYLDANGERLTDKDLTNNAE